MMRKEAILAAGRIVFWLEPQRHLELHIMDADGKNVRQLTHAPGCYNGGPSFHLTANG